MVFGYVVSKLGQFAVCTVGLISRRWCRSPQNVFVDIYPLLFTVFARFKYIPYSNKINIVFSCDKIEILWNNYMWNQLMKAYEGQFLDPAEPEIIRLLPVVIKIIQALSDGLKFQHDCKVSADFPQDYDDDGDKIGGSLEGLVPSRYGKMKMQQTSSSMNRIERFSPRYSTEHLDGLNWEVIVVDSREDTALYCPNGKIVVFTGFLHSARTDAEIAYTVAHEVGHGVAQHASRFPLIPWWLFALIRWPAGLLIPAAIRVWDSTLYSSRSMELEADYIGLMLMASAGYDPRDVPQYHIQSKHELEDYFLDTTHPSEDERARRLSQAKVMDKAVKIYEQVQAGLGVPSFV